MEDEDSRTVWCGNIAENVTEEILYELFLQAAPLERISIPQERGGRKPNYAFIIFKHSKSVPYVIRLLDGISVFNKRLNIKPRTKTQSYDTPINSPNVRDRLGQIVNEPPVNSLSGIPNVMLLGNQFFQNLLHMTPYMGEVNSTLQTPDRANVSRDNRSPRDNRRDERKPYGRNDRHGKNADRSFRNRRF